MKRTLAIFLIVTAFVIGSGVGSFVFYRFWSVHMGTIMHSHNLERIASTVALLTMLEGENTTNAVRSLARDLNAHIHQHDLITRSFGHPRVESHSLLIKARQMNERLSKTE